MLCGNVLCMAIVAVIQPIILGPAPPGRKSESCSRSPRWGGDSEEMAMMTERANGYSDAERQARVELAAAYRLTA